MTNRTVRTLFSFVLALGLAAAAWAGGPKLDLKHFHAHATMSTSGGPRGGMSLEGDLWIKDQKLRLELETPIGKSMTIIDGQTFYAWQASQKQGMKTALDPSRRSSTLMGINDCLATAKKEGSEQVDGVATDRYTYENCGSSGTKTTIWIATKTHWPVRIENVTSGMTTKIEYRDIDTDAKISDSMFAPPADVEFHSMEDFMKSRRGPHPPEQH